MVTRSSERLSIMPRDLDLLGTKVSLARNLSTGTDMRLSKPKVMKSMQSSSAGSALFTIWLAKAAVAASISPALGSSFGKAPLAMMVPGAPG
jgi:hypothetical protein